MSNWSTLKQKGLSDIIKRLDALGVEYRVTAPDGASYGAWTDARVETKTITKYRTGNRYAYGSLKTHVLPYMEPMQPGDECEIPMAHFEVQALHSSIASWAIRLWGVKNYVSGRDLDAGVIRVLRVQ